MDITSIKAKSLNVKIVCGVDRGSSQNTENTEILIELSKLTTFEAFIDVLNNKTLLGPNSSGLIYLKDQKGEMMSVDDDSFNKVKERIIAQTSQDEVYFIIQQKEKLERPEKQDDKTLISSQQLHSVKRSQLDDYWKSKVKPMLDPLINSILLSKPDDSVITINLKILIININRLNS